MNSIPVKFLLGKTFGKNPTAAAEEAMQGSPKLSASKKEEQEELVRQREQEEKILAEKQAVRRYERANVRENIRDKYKLTKGSATDKMIIKNNHERAKKAPSFKDTSVTGLVDYVKDTAAFSVRSVKQSLNSE